MLGFHSIRPDIESGRPLRNTAGAYFAPTLRARCEAPSLAHGYDHSLYLFQLAGALSTGQYKRPVSKQRKRPQTVNRLEGVICLRGVEHGVRGSSGLWTRHYRKVIAASVNLRPSQLEAAASYFGVDVRPRSVRSTFAGSRLRPQWLVVSVSGRLVHWSIQAGCVKTTMTSADWQPARGYKNPPWR